MGADPIFDNLAGNPEYAQVLGEMHAQLQSEMGTLKDVFSTFDPKDAKRAKKGKPVRKKSVQFTEKPSPDEATELSKKHKDRDAKKKASEAKVLFFANASYSFNLKRAE